MNISIFNLFSLGIGPSSSHTVGPMKAANAFVHNLFSKHNLSNAKRIQVELFGSLAFTGVGHGTISAILMGLEGEMPATINPDDIQMRVTHIRTQHQLNLLQQHIIRFDEQTDVLFNYHQILPYHSNGMRFSVYDQTQEIIATTIYYSIGGGFIVSEEEVNNLTATNQQSLNAIQPPYPFNNAKTLMALCTQHNLRIAQLMFANESSLNPTIDIHAELYKIIGAMRACIAKGCQSEGILPGALHLKRRAPQLYQKLMQRGKPISYENVNSMEWLNLFAIAVNEENAAGGRVVTAPTNGAAGIVPAVLEFYLTFYPGAQESDALDFLLTAGAIATLYKQNASLSGAEVGCQGEIGVACSMAAGAFAAILGGTIQQIENAAEIAMEHHLGMTCDPIAGLVQIPCIERNAMGAVKAVNAARLALLGDGQHYVSLDKVIATMKQTGKDMNHIYKETSLGGLAVNLPEC